MSDLGFGLDSWKPEKAEEGIYSNNLTKSPKNPKQNVLDQYLKEVEKFRNKKRFKSKISESTLGMLMALSVMFIIYFLFLWISG